MNIVLDIQALQSEAHATRGIGRYVAQFAQALIDAGAGVQLLACNPALPPPSPGVLPQRLAESRLIEWNTPERLRAIASRGPVVYHVLSPFESGGPPDGVVVPHALLASSVLAVTLHDAIPFRVPARYQPTAAIRRFFAGRAAFVRTADLVLAVSRHTASDAAELLDVDTRRIRVVGEGVSPAFTSPRRGGDPVALVRKALPALRRPFVLTVSGYEPRKDPDTLIRAFAHLPRHLRSQHQLVIACELPSGARDHWSASIRNAGLDDDEVVLTDYVTDDVLRALYQSARVFAFTSTAEGFGLPTLEAAVCGCPAITSDATAIPEVLDEPSSTFPVGDSAALARRLERALTDEQYRATLLGAGHRAAQRHTWANVAADTLRAYESALARAVPPRRPLRRRVALVGPFPPTPSGVATYTARVAAAMSCDADVDCFVEGSVPPAAPAATERLRRFPIEALGSTFSPWSFDAVVYALGNSEFHRKTLGLALQYPGVVWLHDASLAGLYLTSFGLYVDGVTPDLGRARASMRDAVKRCGGRPLGDDWSRPDAYVEAGISMTEEVVSKARATIVTTARAREIVVHAVRPGTPLRVLPLAIPDLAAPGATADEGDPLIVSLGWIDPVKRPDDLVRMLATIRRTMPARLALVGRVTEQQERDLRALATELGCNEALTITGFVGDDEYNTWIVHATCVVLLRRHTHGEGSAAIADAIAAARPVVTNIPTASELPYGVVELVGIDAAVDEIAEVVLRILRDRAYRDRMREASDQYRRSWGFDAVAHAVFDTIASAPPARYPD